ncbi:MAG: peptidoglycan-binding protein [Patescibacteria group bacterium]|nr:peptidoglycan-binding protein [Patescibacteria group bacterium]
MMQFVGFLVLMPLSFGSFSGVAFSQTSEESTPEVTEEDPPAPPEETVEGEGSAGDSGTPAEEGALIETGDAGAGAEVENTANTNVTDTTGIETASSTPEVIEDDTASSTPELLESESSDTASSTPALLNTEEEEATNTASTTVENTNEANVANKVGVDADTGDNSVEGGGDSAIYTGDAFAYANIVNVVNTNILNSNGFLFFLNSLFGHGTLDLKDYLSFFENGGGESPCSLESCEGGGATLNVKNDNNATIVNDVIVRSMTGGNNATSTSGSAGIYTGDAYAAANVFNIANTNITNSNYLMFAFNNFGDYDGDVLLPGGNFFSHLLGANGSVPSGDVTVQNTNEAVVENSVTTEANTGENTAETGGSDGGALIQTGNSYAGSNVANIVNTNLFNSTTVIMMFRIYGNWSGSVFGTPPGISWTETPFGVQLFNTPEETPETDASAENSGGTGEGTLNIENNNTALIKNNVQVYALTGENKIHSEDGQAAIQTGNAYAGANVSNIVNTNILGKNFMFLFFNFFGNWRGNISFGQPDLLTVGSAHSEGSIGPGTDITYNFTVSNLGNADATNVVLENIFDDTFFSFDEYDTVFPEGITWNIGDIPASESVNVSYTAHVANDIPYGETLLRTTVTATGNESDSDPSNNTEVIDVMALYNSDSGSGGGGGGTGVTYTPDPVLKITKTSNASSTVTITASSTVDYTIVVNNEGGSAYHAVLVDTITDEAEEIIHEEYWELGEILPNEEITVTYTVIFNASTTPGTYTNHAQVLSIGRHPSVNPFYGYFADSAVVTSDITISGNGNEEPIPELPLPAPVCEQYLRGFIRTGADNDPAEVTKLQQFLKTYEGFTDLAITGTYDSATLAAVKAFQNKYQEDILGPWGLERNTGFVYFTTKKKINEIYCAGQKEFALSLEEQLEVNAFKTLIGRLKTQVSELPEFTQVGVVNAADKGVAVAEETLEEGNEQEGGRSLVAGAIEALSGDVNQAFRSVTGAVRNGVGKMVSWILFLF